jgi:adenine/guanine/hypoxanthine permease
VGLMMLSPVLEIDLNDFSEAMPAFLVILLMPLSYSISDGLAIGVIGFVVIKLLSGRAKELQMTTCIIAVLFVLKYLFL